MIRKAYVMLVHAGKEEAYEQRHSPIWPELEAALKEHGVQSYSIFLHPETRQLFAYAEIEDNELLGSDSRDSCLQEMVGPPEGSYAGQRRQQTGLARADTKKVRESVGSKLIFEETGIQFMPINTIISPRTSRRAWHCSS